MITRPQIGLIFALVVFFALIIYLLAPILGPFIFGLVVAYIADPLVDKFEEKGLSRTLSVACVFTIIIVALSALMFVLLPLLISQLQALVISSPKIINWLTQQMQPFILSHFDIDLNKVELKEIAQSAASQWHSSSGVLSKIITYFTNSTLGVLGFIFSMVLVPVISFYLLRDFDVLMHNIRSLLPRNIEPSICAWASKCNKVLAAFAHGQLLVMITLSFIYSIGLALLGVNYALLIGLVAALISFIPYLGFILAIVASSLITYFQFDSWLYALIVLGFFFAAHLIEVFVLVPWLIGNKVGLHPVAVIFAVFAGGQLFGFVGLLLALPVASVIMVLLLHIKHEYEESELYDGEEHEHNHKPNS